MNTTVTPQSIDSRRELLIAADSEKVVEFSAQQICQIGKEAVEKRGAFYLALSGGSTPQKIFSRLAQDDLRALPFWEKTYLFWSDERNVPPDSPESNYRNAMLSGFQEIPIPRKQIFRMPAEKELQTAAKEYQKQIESIVKEGSFDLIMLGMGEDGHTASLFPKTEALHTEAGEWVAANYIPEKKCWRMTFTYELIHLSRQISFYAVGKGKAEMLKRVLQGEERFEELPSQRVGTKSHRALWIVDSEAASDL